MTFRVGVVINGISSETGSVYVVLAPTLLSVCDQDPVERTIVCVNELDARLVLIVIAEPSSVTVVGVIAGVDCLGIVGRSTDPLTEMFMPK